MFIALSQFTVANKMAAEVKNAFVDRPHLVEDAPGFIRLEVISPPATRTKFGSSPTGTMKKASRLGIIATCITTRTKEFRKV